MNFLRDELMEIIICCEDTNQNETVISTEGKRERVYHRKNLQKGMGFLTLFGMTILVDVIIFYNLPLMFEIQLIRSPIPLSELKPMAEKQFGSLVKAVVDIEKKIMVIGGEMHADEEIYLLNEGSKQENLWGINIYPDQPSENRVEFDSMINIRPYLGNRSRGVENPEIQKIILAIVKQLITE